VCHPLEGGRCVLTLGLWDLFAAKWLGNLILGSGVDTLFSLSARPVYSLYSSFNRFLALSRYPVAVLMLSPCCSPMPFGQLVPVLLLPPPGFSFDQCLLPSLLLILLEAGRGLHPLPSSLPLLCALEQKGDGAALESFPACGQPGSPDRQTEGGCRSEQVGMSGHLRCSRPALESKRQCR